jgi:hypothetical protein
MMVLNMREYAGMIKNLHISIIYSGPMWDDEIKGIAEILKTRLHNDDLPGSAAKNVFSVFVEQTTNMLMYSAEKKKFVQPDKEAIEIPTGTLVLGEKDKTYFIQTGNAIKSGSAELIKNRIDHLNSLDKKGLRQYQKERLKAENDTPESKGAGLGLIEIARRATAPIAYTFEPMDDNLTYFTMYVEIGQEKQGE